MRRFILPFAACLGAITATASTALAANLDMYGNALPDVPAVTSEPNLVIDVGAGVGTAPAYEGSADYATAFVPIIKVERLNIPGLTETGSGDHTGFSIHPSFSYVGVRASAGHAALSGLDDVAATYGAGAKLAYEWKLGPDASVQVYGAARYTFGGASGLVGEVGANLIARPAPGLEIIIGPVLNLASNSYMDTYFGVTPAQALQTGGRLTAFDPEGGLKSVGFSASGRYEFLPDYFLNVDASYHRMVGGAANSPIVQAGSQNQFTISAGLSRRFSLF
ncbi:MAG: hypothetical protein JWN11_577 [Hyphomicrobiales bacterium]|nr:hypothetical protein [Hyphomicrobiales bacterium]